MAEIWGLWTVVLTWWLSIYHYKQDVKLNQMTSSLNLKKTSSKAFRSSLWVRLLESVKPYPFMQPLAIWVDRGAAPGTLRKKGRNPVSTGSVCLQSQPLPPGVSQTFLMCFSVLNSRHPAQSGSKQIHKSFVYTQTSAFPIRSWQRALQGEPPRRYVCKCQRRNKLIYAICTYDTATAIDGEPLRDSWTWARATHVMNRWPAMSHWTARNWLAAQIS